MDQEETQDTEQEGQQKQIVRTEDQQLAYDIENISFMVDMLKKLKVDHGLRSVQMARSPKDYYTWDLPKRMAFLGAPCLDSLCKTIIMKNSEYNS